MKKLALGALFAGLAAACGGGSDKPMLIDAPTGDGNTSPTCNPLTQTGCNAGEKCTWINDQDNPPIGHVGCAPDGTIAIGGACTDPPAGPMGYDQCAKGSVCLSGECKQICDHNGGQPTCDTNHACTRYADFFESGGTTVAGVCDPACDPLTQDLKVGTNKTACGSTMPAMPNKGCYGYDEYSCAPAGMDTWARTDRTMPRTNASGNPYLNGCAPGYIPFFYERTGSTVTLCTGFCAAMEVNNAQPMTNKDGDDTKIGKLVMSAAPAAGDATCAAQKKGSVAGGQEVCKFIWWYLEDDQGMLTPAFEQNTALLNGLGVCFANTQFMYDSNMDMMPDTQVPDCTALPPRSGATTGEIDDAADWGCQLRANSMFAPGQQKTKNPFKGDFRIPKNLPLELVRHNLN